MAQVAAGFQLQRPVSLAVSREREAERARRLGGDERLPQRRPLDLAPVVEHVANIAAGNDGAELANLVGLHAVTAVHPQQRGECGRRDDVDSLLGPVLQFADVAGRRRVHGRCLRNRGAAFAAEPAGLVLGEAEAAVLEGGEVEGRGADVV